MLDKNKKLLFIRCNKHQYLVKKGSMSNYSFNIFDEERDGFLDFVFERVNYPIEKGELAQLIDEKLSISDEEVNERIDELIDLDIFTERKADENEVSKACLFFNQEISEKVQSSFCEKNPQLLFDSFAISHQSVFADYENSRVELAINESKIVIVITSYFSPNLFYELNAKCIEYNKMLLIAYLDGDEGVIVPFDSPMEKGCYNDFELLRESSFHNLLDYQMMKEKLSTPELDIPQHEELFLDALLINTTLIMREVLASTKINQYGYSFDFERMVNTKTKLIRFPNCPSCQGDSNISHPFI